MLLIMLMLIEKKGKVDQLDFAARLHNWMLHGFAEFGDLGDYTVRSCRCTIHDWVISAGGMGIGMTVSRTLKHAKFLTDPVGAAQNIWEDSG